MDSDQLSDTLTAHGRTLTLVTVLLLAAAVSTAGAATPVTVSLATADSVTVSETATVDVVVEDVDGGVGAYELTVTLSDASVAQITDVELDGDPGVENVSVASDGSSVWIRAALIDTADTGRVTIASLTVRGEDAGDVDFDVTVSALSDEKANNYAPQTSGAALSVVDTDGSESGSNDDSGGVASDTAGSGAGDFERTTTPEDSGAPTSTPDVSDDRSTPADSDTEDASADAASGSSGSQSGDATVADSPESMGSEATAANSDRGQSSRFGISSDLDTLDRVFDGVGGPVGVVAAAVVGVLVWFGFRTRR
jgi:hypothetical protein